MTHIVCPHCDGVNRIPANREPAQAKCGKCRGMLFVGEPLPVDEPRFQRHLSRNDIPLLVDFWAEWCAPCRMMAPAFAQAAKTLEPGMRLLKVDTEKDSTLAARYGIRSIPTLMVLRDGSEVGRMAGAMDAQGLINWARQYM